MTKSWLAFFIALVLFASGCSKQTPEQHLSAAKQFIDSDNPQAAVIELKNAIKLNTQYAEARFLLGKIYLDQRQYESAEKELNRALELGYDSAQILPLISQAYQRTGAVNALAALDITDASLPSAERIKVGFYKLQGLVELDKRNQASVLIDELLALDTSSAYKGLVETYMSILENDIETALKTVTALREQAPLNEDVMRTQLNLQLRVGERESAVETFEDLIRIRPDDLETKFTYAALLVDMKMYEKAEPLVDELIEVTSENGLLNQFKGTIFASEEKHEEALEYFENAIRYGQDNGIVKLLAGVSAYRTQKYADAVKYLSEIADLIPPEHPALRVLADSQLLLGQSEEASDVLSNIVENQNDASLFSRAGYQLIRQGNVEEAKKVVNRGAELSTSTADLLQMGVLKLSLNDMSGLVKLEQAVEQSPESTATNRTLVSAYLLTGEIEKAKSQIAEWKTASPQDYSPYLLSSEIAIRENDPDTATANIAKAKQLAPDRPEPKLAEFNLMVYQQKNDEALSYVKSIVNDYPQHTPALASYYIALKGAGNGGVALELAESRLIQNDSQQLRILVASMQFDQQLYTDTLSTLNTIQPDRFAPPSFWLLRGQSLLRSNQMSEAEAHYDQWLSVSPLNREATIGRLMIIDARQDFEKGLQVSDAFLDKRQDTQIFVLKGYFHARLGQTQQAQTVIDSLDPSLQELPFIKGVISRLHFQRGDYDKAASDANIAYKANPELSQLLVLIASLEAQGKNEDAFEVLQIHTQTYPADQGAKVLFAERQLKKDKDEAIATYETIQQQSPDNLIVLNNLAYLYLEKGEIDEALPLAQRAVELQPALPAAVDTLAQIYLAKDDFERARDLYDTVMNNPVDNDEVVQNYVTLLVKQGDVERARRRFNNHTWQDEQRKKEVEALF